MAYFPMYIDLTDKQCLVVGGGTVALRKVQVLLDFDARIHVTAETICDEIKGLWVEYPDRIVLSIRKFIPEDCKGKELVVAATDDTSLNHAISDHCRRAGIPVNAVDQKEDCTFIFPSYIKEQHLVAAFSSGGDSPIVAQYLKEKEKEILTPTLGQISVSLGEIRRLVQERIGSGERKKAVYKEILIRSLEENRRLLCAEMLEIVEKYEI